jgi:hypothetical protein
MVRIFSNIPLHWSQLPVVRLVGKRYPGNVMNLHLFHIKHRKPIHIESHSPLHILQKKHIYYSYHLFYGKHIHVANDIQPCVSSSDQPIYLPSMVEKGDIIAVEDHQTQKERELFLPGLLFVL